MTCAHAARTFTVAIMTRSLTVPTVAGATSAITTARWSATATPASPAVRILRHAATYACGGACSGRAARPAIGDGWRLLFRSSHNAAAISAIRMANSAAWADVIGTEIEIEMGTAIEMTTGTAIETTTTT